MKSTLNRRRFLQSTAALALPAIVPASVLGQDAPSNQVLMGVIGTGGRGNDVMRWFVNSNPLVRFVAVCDCFAERRQNAVNFFNERHGANTAKPYTDFREVLARPEIEGVLVTTPDHWHVPVAIAAARAGKAMYVEKPLGVSMVWAWELRKAIQQNGSVFQYGTQQRSSRDFRFACELARNGYLGAIQRVDAWCAALAPNATGSTEPIPVPTGFDYDRWLGPAPVTPFTADRCTSNGTYHHYDNALGFIAGWGAHPLDIAQWGLDADQSGPVHYEGKGVIPTTGIFHTVCSWDIHCRYASGVTMHFMDSGTAQPIVSKYRPFLDHGTTFFGTEGWASVDRGGLHLSDEKLRRITLKPTDTHLYNSPDHTRNFVECLRSRAATINPFESAIRSDTISHLSDICIRTGRPIAWDPATETIQNDPVATRMLNRPLRGPWHL